LRRRDCLSVESLGDCGGCSLPQHTCGGGCSCLARVTKLRMEDADVGLRMQMPHSPLTDNFDCIL
jgi:hypothetical protein